MITVIVPVYNEAPFLRRCLTSLVKQTHKPEVILVDDCSTDGSDKICDEYKSYGFVVHHFKKNYGVSKARNYGIDHAKTKWITFVDADDELALDAIENMENATRKKAYVYQFNQLRVFNGNPPVQKYRTKPGRYLAYFPPKQWVMVWNKLYDIEFLKKHNIRFDEDMLYGEDEKFNLDCLKHLDTIKVCEEKTIIRHFENQNSITHQLNDEEILLQRKKLLEVINGKDSLEHRRFTQRLLDEHHKSKRFKHLNHIM